MRIALSVLLTLLFAGCGRIETAPQEPVPAGTLTAGAYRIEALAASEDACDVARFFVVGDPIGVTIADPVITFEIFPGFHVGGEIEGGSVVAEREEQVDWRPELDCVEDDATVLQGTITGDDRLDSVLAVSFSPVESSMSDACRQANAGLVLPCSSRIEMPLAKVQP